MSSLRPSGESPPLSATVGHQGLVDLGGRPALPVKLAPRSPLGVLEFASRIRLTPTHH